MGKNRTGKIKLKTGFSTGACVAACARAAFIKILGLECNDNITALFPDNKTRKMNLNSITNYGNSCCVSIIKDAGSDPDITNGMLIECELEILTSKHEIDPRDYKIKIRNSILIIRGEKGVGTVTRRGVEPEKGKWAINPGPIKMITQNLTDAGFGNTTLTNSKTYILKISLQNGEKLALKTLNPLLGIEGGLSILGTTGIVVPYSHEAYIETIRILISSLDRDKYNHIVFTTGAQSTNAAKKVLSNLPEEAFIRIGDFIADSLKIVSTKSIKKVSVSCMPGKLFKYASSFDNTNAKYNQLDTTQICSLGKDEDFEFTDNEKNIIYEALTIREVIQRFPEISKNKLILSWKKLAIIFFKKILNNENIEVELFAFDFDGQLIT
jgi:cobalt-precorrin-5B (C1)-methyltransferase